VFVITVPHDFSSNQQTPAESGRIDRPFRVSFPDYLAYFNRESRQAVAEPSGGSCPEILAGFPIDPTPMKAFYAAMAKVTLGRQLNAFLTRC
jgi:hypothetical protein